MIEIATEVIRMVLPWAAAIVAGLIVFAIVRAYA